MLPVFAIWNRKNIDTTYCTCFSPSHSKSLHKKKQDGRSNSKKKYVMLSNIINSLYFSKYELCRSVYSLRGVSIHSFCPLAAVKEVQGEGRGGPPIPLNLRLENIFFSRTLKIDTLGASLFRLVMIVRVTWIANVGISLCNYIYFFFLFINFPSL